MKRDLAIEEIRKVRHRISSEFDHNIKAILDYYKSLEANYKDRIYSKAQYRLKKSLSRKSPANQV
jgi:hypothetical protein